MKGINKLCFAEKDGECTALRGVDSCKNCPFFKTETTLNKEREKSRKRLSTIACG